MNVREYFESKFKPHMFNLDVDHDRAEEGLGDILAEMPLDSNCGDGCKQAIDACAAFVECIKMAYGEYDYPEYINETLHACVHTCVCFIRG